MKSCRECQYFRDYFGGLHNDGYCIKKQKRIASMLEAQLESISCQEFRQSNK